MSEDTKQIEFERQNRKRLADEHPTITPREWILIRVALEEKVDFNTDPDLDVEEYGEICRAALGNGKQDHDLKREIIHLAAVLMAIYEDASLRERNLSRINETQKDVKPK